MALSPQDVRLVLKRLSDKAFQTSQERDQLLAQLASAEGIKARDLAWMLFARIARTATPRSRCSSAWPIPRRPTR